MGERGKECEARGLWCRDVGRGVRRPSQSKLVIQTVHLVSTEQIHEKRDPELNLFQSRVAKNVAISSSKNLAITGVTYFYYYSEFGVAPFHVFVLDLTVYAV